MSSTASGIQKWLSLNKAFHHLRGLLANVPRLQFINEQYC